MTASSLLDGPRRSCLDGSATNACPAPPKTAGQSCYAEADSTGARLSAPRRLREGLGDVYIVVTAADSTSELFSYAELAQNLAAGEERHFAARLLREVAIRSRRVTDTAAVDFIHRDPGLTGIRGWDALIGGVASMTGRGRVSNPTVLDWCFEQQRYCTDEMFTPFDVPAKYFWIDYLRTPVELQVRNVIFPAGNLEGV